jgi:hypothetical protein
MASWCIMILTGLLMKRCENIFIVVALTGFAVISAGCSKSETNAETKPEVAANAPALKWEKKLIRHPGTSAEDGKVYVVQGGKRRWVLAGVAWLTEHGYKWPEDVSVIPAEEFDSIPTGDPIQ